MVDRRSCLITRRPGHDQQFEHGLVVAGEILELQRRQIAGCGHNPVAGGQHPGGSLVPVKRPRQREAAGGGQLAHELADQFAVAGASTARSSASSIGTARRWLSGVTVC